MTPVIGIDLGTTNTVVAVVKDGQASAIADEEGNVLMPSVVSFHPSGNVLVGRAAKQRRLVDSVNTIYSVKRLIGRSWDSEEVRRARSRFPFQIKEGPGQAALVVARGEAYTLPEISAFVLRKAKSIAENALGTPIERAVITVPANFNDLQRAATKVAGRVAGLEVMRILNEPTAAALAYGYGRSSSERLAVYDFGGGTFDVTLLDLSDNVFEVLATAGNTFLGGDDLDLAIAERMAEAFLSLHRYDPRSEPQVYEHLKVAAEDLKHRLSSEQEATVQLRDIAHGAGGKQLGLNFTMTRADLERLALPLVDRTFEVCSEALSIARLSPSDFQQLLLVGGSTRVPLVKRRVEEFWKREVRAHISPDEVVAIGAAIQASALSGAEQRRKGTVPPPPNPARAAMPPGEQRQRSDTAPGPAPFAGATRLRTDSSPLTPDMPNTQPFQGRSRTSTKPGVQAGADPDAPSRHAALGVWRPDGGTRDRSKQPTGAGLGPVAERAMSGPTLVSATAAAESARTAAEAALPLVLPEAQLEPRADSVAFQLADDEIQDLTGTPPARAPGLRPLAQPMAFAQAEHIEGRGLASPPALSKPTAPPAVATLGLALSTPGASVPLAPVLIDVTPLTLGVETVEGFCDSIIGRNTTVPCACTREFVTAQDHQTAVKVRVSQGESKRFVENTLLGEVELSGLRPALRGDVRIAVTFALDASGMLEVSAKDVGTGRKTSTQVHLVGLPDAAEVGRMAARQVDRGV